MKKNLIALAVASAIAAPVAMADAPTIYGKLNLNISSSEGGDNKVGSTDSRIGVKGSEDLGNGLKAVYKLEFALNEVADDNKACTNSDCTSSTGVSMSSRNQYLGLAGGFGTVLMGRHDTPLKMSQASDLFGDGKADIKRKELINDIKSGEDRVANVLAYVSPTFSGVKLVAATTMDGDKTTEGHTSAALMYGSTKKGLYLAAAMTDYGDSEDDITRFSAQYKTGGLTANAIYQDVKNQGSFTQLQAAYKIGKFMPKAKVTMADSDVNGNTTGYALGLNYSLGKKTTAYVYNVVADKDITAAKDAVVVGMVHKF